MKSRISFPLILWALVFAFLQCSLPTEESEGWVEEKYPLCIMNSDGTGYRVLREGFYARDMSFINSDSQIVAVGSSGVDILSLNGATVISFLFNLRNVYSSTLSSDGKLLAFVASEENQPGKDIYLINSDGTNLTKLTNTADVPEQHLSFSAGNDMLIYSTNPLDYKSASIEFIDLSKQRITVLLTTRESVNPEFGPIPFWYPTFNFNEEKIFFYWQKQNESTWQFYAQLHAIDILRRRVVLIDNSASIGGAIETTANMDQILYLHLGDDARLTVIDSEGTLMWQPDLPPAINSVYHFSPTANEFAFGKMSGYNHEDDYIYTVNLDTKTTKRLRLGAFPVYSSSGQKIVFIGYNRIVHN